MIIDFLTHLNLNKHLNYIKLIQFEILIKSLFVFRTIFIESVTDFGGPSKNGTWSGIIGQVQSGNIDICSIIMQKERLEAIDYLKPMSTDR